MSGFVFLLLWLAIVAFAFWLSQPGEEERELVGDVGLAPLLFSLEEERNRARWSLEAETVARKIRRRALLGGLLALAPLPIWFALSGNAPAGDAPEELAIEQEVDADEGPAARLQEKPAEEKVLVRTYRRKEGDRGPPEVIEEYRVETLEEKRDPIRLYGTAKVAAKYDIDQLLGITITNIQPGSFWEMVGFRDGDFILEANGELMDNPNTSVAFMNSMHDAPEVIVRVRGADDVERTLLYTAPRD